MYSLLALILACVFLFVLVLSVIIFLPFYFTMIRPARERRKLLEQGRPGTGLIRTVRDTGVTIRGQYQVRLNLEISPGDGSPVFEATIKALVPRIDPGRYKAGQEIRVMYNPATNAVVVDDRPA